jgi:hypothetical protein
MPEKTSKLTPRKRRAIEALAVGESYEAAATVAGVTVRTIYRWRHDPDFIAGLQAADADHLAGLARSVNGAAHDALDVLTNVMQDASQPAGVRVRAASEVLKHRAAFYELLTVGDRLTALEQALAGNKTQ